MKQWLAFLSLSLLVACSPVEDKVYKVGRDPEWFPVELLGRQNAVTAFSDELLHTIAREEEMRLSVHTVEGHTLAHELRNGSLDGILASIPPLARFREYYDFSDVYLYVGPVLVVRNESSAKALDDLAGKTVGVVTGTTDVLIAKIPNVVINRYESIIQALQALYENRIDGAVIASIPAYAYLRDLYQGSLKVATPPLTDDGLKLVVLKGEHHDLIEAFNRGLKEAKKSGDYAKLAEQWQLDLDIGIPKSGNHDPKITNYWSKNVDR